MKGCRERNIENPMCKHIWESHEGKRGEELFTMKMEGGFKKPLARQIRESVEIESSKGEVMNSKSEWNNSRIHRIVIEAGEKQIEDQESGLGKKGEWEKRVLRRGAQDLVRERNSKKESSGQQRRRGGHKYF